jgi:hypothetical protein
MSTRTSGSRVYAGLLAGAVCLSLPVSGLAANTASASVQLVKVFSNHYEAAGKRFADLDKLEAWVKTTGARGLVFNSCMSESTKPLAAALERFQHVYVDVRWSMAGESGCPAVTTAKDGRSR